MKSAIVILLIFRIIFYVEAVPLQSVETIRDGNNSDVFDTDNNYHIRIRRSPPRGNATHIFKTRCNSYRMPNGQEMTYRTVEIVRRHNATARFDSGSTINDDSMLMEVDSSAASGETSDSGRDWRLQTPYYFNSVGVYNDDGYRLYYDEATNRMFRYNDTIGVGAEGYHALQEVSPLDYNTPVVRP